MISNLFSTVLASVVIGGCVSGNRYYGIVGWHLMVLIRSRTLQKVRLGIEDDNLGLGVIFVLLSFSIWLFLRVSVNWGHLIAFGDNRWINRSRIMNIQKLPFFIGDGIWVMGNIFPFSSGRFSVFSSMIVDSVVMADLNFSVTCFSLPSEDKMD